MNKGVKVFLIFMLFLVAVSPVLDRISADIDELESLPRLSDKFMVSPPQSNIPLDDVFATIGDSYVYSENLGTVVITDNERDKLGALWTKGQVDLSSPFVYKSYLYWGRSQSAAMRVHNGQSGGDGMTVTLHNDPRALEAIGGPGGALGSYQRPSIPTDIAIKNGISYEIDPFINDAIGGLDQGMSINLENPNLSRHMAFVRPDDAIGIEKHSALSSFESKEFRISEWNQFDIEWIPDLSGSGELIITTNGHSSSFEIADYRAYFGGEYVYIGYTGSTGGATALQGVVLTELPKFDWFLHFDLNGGSGQVPNSQHITEGSLAEKVSEPEKDGYKFIGWNTDRDGLGITWDFNNTLMPGSDVTLYAQFKQILEGAPVSVKHEDTEGNEVAPSEELVGKVDELFETNPVIIPGWNLLKVPDNASGVFTLEPQTVTYVYERIIGSPVKVYHIDENENEVAPSEELTGYWGDTFETNPVIIPGMNVLEFPDNASGIFSDNPQSVIYVYEVSGNLSFEYPETIKFDTMAIQSKEMLLKRTDQNLGVKVTDTRIGYFQQNWVLTLSLEEELHSGDHQIPGALVYGEDNNFTPLNEGAQEIYRKTEPSTEAVNINWQEDEGLLIIIPGNKALPGKYQGKVLWSLVIGP